MSQIAEKVGAGRTQQTGADNNYFHSWNGPNKNEYEKWMRIIVFAGIKNLTPYP
jgi:hypothetical protein